MSLSIISRNMGRLSSFGEDPLLLSKKRVRTILYASLIVVVSLLFGEVIARGEVRLAIVVSVILVLGVLCFRIQTGVTALLVYLPLMAFLRRYIYTYNSYVMFDPILLVSSLLTLFMFLYITVTNHGAALGFHGKNPIVRFATWLLILFAVEVFNPLQGGLFVGASGAIFFLFPMMWFYFGKFIDARKMHNILYLIVFIGFITSVYGLKQNFLGYSGFEKYWLKYGGYGALSIKGWMRPVSTFTNSQEYTTFIMIAGIVSAALVMKNRRNMLLVPVIGVILVALIMSATRGALFGLFLGIGLYAILGVKKLRTMGILVGVAVTVFIGLVSVVDVPSVKVVDSTSAYLQHTSSGMFDPFAERSTFWIHWRGTKGAFLSMFRMPVGYGLGAGTLAATKFGGTGIGSEGFISSLQVSTGLLGFVLFLFLFFLLLRDSFVKYRETGDFFSRLIFVITLEVFFTIDLRLYSIGPLVWLLWGYFAYHTNQESHGPARPPSLGAGGGTEPQRFVADESTQTHANISEIKTSDADREKTSNQQGT